MPAFVVLTSGFGQDQPLLSRYWGSGFLPSNHQGVEFRSQGEPILFVSNPKGIDDKVRRRLLDSVRDLNQLKLDSVVRHRNDCPEPDFKTDSKVELFPGPRSQNARQMPRILARKRSAMFIHFIGDPAAARHRTNIKYRSTATQANSTPKPRLTNRS